MDTDSQVLAKLNAIVIKTAKFVHQRIGCWEIEQLKQHDPSFDDIAKQCRVITGVIKVSYDDPELMVSVHKESVELVEILESVAYAIKHDSEKLLVDNITHLSEFIENKERRDENR